MAPSRIALDTGIIIIPIISATGLRSLLLTAR